jgi:predicted dinucleotide-binding enzyme
MNKRILMVVLAGALAAGCKKHEAATQAGASPSPDQPAASASGSAPQEAAPVAPAAAPADQVVVAIPAGANVNATLAELTRQVRRYIVRNKNAPSDFDAFVAAAHVQVPPPPTGKKYAITSKWKVVLVNR